MACLLGIDNGATVTKAVAFDESAAPLAVARRRIAQANPAPRHVERDMDAMRRETAAAIREAVAASGRPASDIKALGATAHGDGLYLIDRARRAACASARPRAGALLADRRRARRQGRAAVPVDGRGRDRPDGGQHILHRRLPSDLQPSDAAPLRPEGAARGAAASDRLRRDRRRGDTRGGGELRVEGGNPRRRGPARRHGFGRRRA